MVDPAELRALFDEAACLPPVEREAFLARACGGNPALRREVERLLAADAQTLHLLNEGSHDDTPSSAPTRRDARGRWRCGRATGSGRTK
jgi:hypothetical protein